MFPRSFWFFFLSGSFQLKELLFLCSQLFSIWPPLVLYLQQWQYFHLHKALLSTNYVVWSLGRKGGQIPHCTKTPHCPKILFPDVSKWIQSAFWGVFAWELCFVLVGQCQQWADVVLLDPRHIRGFLFILPYGEWRIGCWRLTSSLPGRCCDSGYTSWYVCTSVSLIFLWLLNSAGDCFLSGV